MVKDGTVQFEVPGDIKLQNLDFGIGDFHNEATDAELVEEAQVIPPLQIVMLIVGTRGDVQPFVAIGKCLQVIIIFLLFMSPLIGLVVGKSEMEKKK